MPQQTIYCPECNHAITQQYRSLSREEADLIINALDLAISKLDGAAFVLDGLEGLPDEAFDPIEEKIAAMKKLRRALCGTGTPNPRSARTTPPVDNECRWCAEGYVRTVSSVNEQAYVHAGTPVGRVVCTRIEPLSAQPDEPQEGR